MSDSENYYKAPEIKADDRTPAVAPPAIGGWLILVGIGIVLSPFRYLVDTYKAYQPIFTDGTWEQFAHAASTDYSFAWKSWVIGDLIFSALYWIAMVRLAYLFFRRDARFPSFFILLALIPIAYLLIDSIIAQSITGTEELFGSQAILGLARSIIYALIWILYMLNSERVKETFIRRD